MERWRLDFLQGKRWELEDVPKNPQSVHPVWSKNSYGLLIGICIDLEQQ
jgi:hypothetical protein